MGKSGSIRIGIVGAGRVSRARLIPGFRAIPGVRLVGVCNQTRESSGRVAREFEIPRTYGSWEALIEDDEIDAVVIGAWPSLHCPITLAALDAGKHVLTQSRMAMNAREAQRMLDRSRECPGLAAMVVPSAFGLAGDAFVRKLIAGGLLGTIREVHVTGLTSELADPETPLDWRQSTRHSGFNMLDLGCLHEAVMRWAPPARRLLASAWKMIPTRIDPESGLSAKVGTADSIQVIVGYQGGARGTYRLSGVVWHGTGSSVTLYGSDGTLTYDLTRESIQAARRGDPELRPVPIPEALRGGWTVEADFIAAIRGERAVTRTSFAEGVEVMQFTEAVARSSRHLQPVELPLREFSNPSL